ncbi:MAG: hypothetical protein K0M40_07775 [Prolixibacteraceae bacterium]|nr:hypothetical protein [Prolixibacteraceae bacterium]
MLKHSFVFDERNIPDAEKSKEIGFEYKSIEKSDNQYFTIFVENRYHGNYNQN